MKYGEGPRRVSCPWVPNVLATPLVAKHVWICTKFNWLEGKTENLIWIWVTSLVPLWFDYHVVVEISSRTPVSPRQNYQQCLEESKSILIKVNCLRNSKLVLEFKYRRPSGSRVTVQNNILNVLIICKDRMAYQNFNASAMCNFCTQFWVGLERTIDSANWKWSIVWDLILYWTSEKNENSFSLAFHLNIWEKKYVYVLGGKIIYILWKCFDALM